MEYFDTLSVYDRLAKSGLPDTTSRELSEILRETLKQQLSEVATKRDIEGLTRDIDGLKSESLRKDIKADLAQMQVSLIKWNGGMYLNVINLRILSVSLTMSPGWRFADPGLYWVTPPGY
ncbi:MAG: hypothetical protein HQK60_17995 [Deltaproteobacteria bacterium]|nr:hypothetical protein [Deltaproteobacteria bacterium]